MRISVITPTIDGSVFLDEAVASVQQQDYANIEHILVHDGSDSFIARLRSRHPRLRVLRGEGNGATAAVKLGLDAATGEFIFCLNSDDRIVPGSMAYLLRYATKKPSIRIWTGGARVFKAASDGTDKTVRLVTGRAMTAMNLGNVLDDLPLVTSRFIHRSVIAEIGNFDPTFSESSDREFMLRAVIAQIPEDYLGVVISELRMHEGSRTIHRNKNWVPPYLAEHLRLADLWLSRTDLPPGVVRSFRNWRAREALRTVLYQLRAGQQPQAMRSLCAAVSSDPLWLLRATTVLAAWWRRHRS
ncbi:MAG TPA: glycosyltransferase [Stellaceae bacterium]|nr:glycosyltransferase [Stellaceae bacterium]